MDLLNRKKVKELESFLDDYRVRNKQLEDEIKLLQDYKLKYKIAQMLVDDDPAIDELLSAHKEKAAALRVTEIIDDRGSSYSAFALAQAQGRAMAQRRQEEMTAMAGQWQQVSQLQNQMSSDLQRQRQSLLNPFFNPWP